MPSGCSSKGESKGAACRACSSGGVSWLCSDSPEIGTVFEEDLVSRDEGSGTGSAGELMDLMRRLLRLREGACVVFENGRVMVEDWVWLRKYVKPRILERGVKVDGAGLSVDGDDEAVGINECFKSNDQCQSVDSGVDSVLCQG